MSLFLFYFFNILNHFIPSTFWNNSLESTNSDEHLLEQESHGHSLRWNFSLFMVIKGSSIPFTGESWG